MIQRLAGVSLLLGVLLLTSYLGTTLWRSLTAPATVQVLPTLELTALNGSSEHLERTGGAPTVVHLWTTDCVACRDELELLARASRSARYGGFRYLFINQGNDEAVIRRYLELNELPEGFAEDIYLDPDNRAYDAFNATGLPASYFFSGSGELHEAQGVIGRPNRLEHTLEPLVEQP